MSKPSLVDIAQSIEDEEIGEDMDYGVASSGGGTSSRPGSRGGGRGGRGGGSGFGSGADSYDEEGFDDADVDAAAAALMKSAGRRPSPSRRSPSRGGRASSRDATSIEAKASRLTSAAEDTMDPFHRMFGHSKAHNAKRYFRVIVLRSYFASKKSRLYGTYDLKYSDGEKKVGVEPRFIRLPAGVREEDVTDDRGRFLKGVRLEARKPVGARKDTFHAMSVPAVLRKSQEAKGQRRFASDEDAAECTFAPKSRRRGRNNGGHDGQNRGGESKMSADFLMRMEAKENARRVELARKRREAENLLRKANKTKKKWTDEDGDRFIKRLAEAEAKKQKKYAELQKKLKPAFSITQRKVYNKDTGKIETVAVEKPRANTAAFLAKLEQDAADREARKAAKVEARLLAETSQARLVQSRSSSRGNIGNMNNTYG